MITELLVSPGALGAFVVAVIVFGFAPGLVLAAFVRLIPDLDRRAELQAELYEVPRWERPFWVAQQFEVALRVGVGPKISWLWGRHVWHRSKLVSGLKMHQQHPDTFGIPSPKAKKSIRPGDSVKLMWDVTRLPGERMWVEVSEREGDRLRGTLENYPMFVHLDPGAQVEFHIDDIIDYELTDADPSDASSIAA